MDHRLVAIAVSLLGSVGCSGQGNPASDAGADGVAPQDGSPPPADAATDTTGPAPDGGGLPPAGWLYTAGNKIYVSNGSSGTAWMGRGVNMDDVFLCGYNSGFWMTGPDGEGAITGMLASLMSGWKPTFLRISLSMNSYAPFNISWKNDTSQYATHMTNIINAVGTYPGTYVLVTLRSEASMVNGTGQQCANGGDDAVCIPTSATDAVYRAIVDAFKDKAYVLFGVSNEPGGGSATDNALSTAMSHAVGVIRAEEDSLGVPHHIVSVQGNNWTSKIGFYDSAPLPYDNVVYEYHSYPPAATGQYGYTQANIPVIIGEYGPSGSDLTFATGFYADVEAKQIPNLAWDLDTYNNCSPDLATVTHTTSITASAWGQVVQTYLNAH